MASHGLCIRFRQLQTFASCYRERLRRRLVVFSLLSMLSNSAKSVRSPSSAGGADVSVLKIDEDMSLVLSCARSSCQDRSFLSEESDGVDAGGSTAGGA